VKGGVSLSFSGERSVTAIGPVKSDSFREHHAVAITSSKQLGGIGIMAQVGSHAAGFGVTCRKYVCRKGRTHSGIK
jgi:hypothetical protein